MREMGRGGACIEAEVEARRCGCVGRWKKAYMIETREELMLRFFIFSWVPPLLPTFTINIVG